MSDYPLTDHTVSHIISELASWQMEERRPLTDQDIEAQLRDAGYGSACYEQVKEAWFGTFEASRFTQVPIDRDLHHFGEARTRVEPNADYTGDGRRGVNLTIWHVMLPPEGANTMFSTDEAFALATDLRRAAFQTDGQDPDKALMPAQEQVTRWLSEEDHGGMFAATVEAVAKSAGNVREMAVAMLLAISYETNQNIAQVAHDLCADAIVLDAEMER